MSSFVRGFTALIVLICSTAVASAGSKLTVRAGAYAMDVTPEKFPVSVNGGFSDRQATKANDPLHARCLVLDDGKTKLAIVVVDSCVVPRDLIDAAKKKAEAKTGIPATNMLISGTHTHTAPTLTSVFGSDPNPEYVTFLTEKIAAGIEKAAVNLEPAELAWGSVQESSELFNRRWKMKPGTVNLDPFGGTTDVVRMNPGNQNPGLLEQAGTVDPEVSVLAVRSSAGRPLALLANYSLHYVGDLPALSADYFGVFGDRVGGAVGADDKEPKFVGILSNGTSGDVNNIDFSKPPLKSQPGERCRTVAETVVKAVGKATTGATYHADVTLAAAVAELELGVRKPTAAEIERATGVLARLGGKPARTAEEVYAGETIKIANYPDTVKVPLQALRIGDLGIVAIPCEVFTEIGLEIKKKSPIQRTFTIELANGYNGYLPTPAQHKLGGYETWRARSSYLEVGASEKIVPAVLKLLDKVAVKKG
ncbi:hypothetical protein [Fimbriiglobus ruber]|uniref:Alkaline ceramidase domain protein n=1 Tax=Fimbriiglobus ruber TaxID=1908690 RepID=A0A225EFE2_9BACT|nr:hypothetical protein [Fimbriiglobus ruber]OWK47075.1 Alkaline ceramidase domain protein [Fimbriiglobus ruber]